MHVALSRLLHLLGISQWLRIKKTPVLWILWENQPPLFLFLARFNYCRLFLQREHMTVPSLHLSPSGAPSTERKRAESLLRAHGSDGNATPFHSASTPTGWGQILLFTDQRQNQLNRPCEQQPSLPLGGRISSESAHCSGEPSRRLLEGIN